ncbi:MAG: permease [Candidatus Omnitrophica bacterium]|nr:permease [Candidatus Omnitrophota bacterium]
MSTDACCHQEKKWYQKRTWWIVGASLLLGLVSSQIPLFKSFSVAFWGYLRIIGWAIGVGILLGGLIDHFVPKEYISKFLSQPKKRTVFYATGLGLIASTCSHGVLALSMELHKKGASGPAVISFLLASPWSNFPVTLLLISLFGWKGILIILAAFIIALITGFIFQWLDKKGWIERNPYTSSDTSSFSIREDFRGRINGYRPTFAQLQKDLKGIGRGILELSEMVLGWVILGVFLASLAQAYIPSHIFQNYLGPNLMGLVVTLVFATILEVCSEGTAPLAFEIYRQTQALGNSFVFLCAGVVTDYMEIGLVWKNLGRKTALWMIAIGVPQVLIWGYLFNLFF